MKNSFFWKKREGFTLVEMLIVVGIVAVLLLVAVPSLVRSRINANEVATIGNCMAVSNGCVAYYYNVNPHNMPVTLDQLGPPTSSPGYIDSTLAQASDQPEKQGYKFSYKRVNSDEFSLQADPVKVNLTGCRHFFVDQTGYIRVNASAPASENDPMVSQ